MKRAARRLEKGWVPVWCRNGVEDRDRGIKIGKISKSLGSDTRENALFFSAHSPFFILFAFLDRLIGLRVCHLEEGGEGSGRISVVVYMPWKFPFRTVLPVLLVWLPTLSLLRTVALVSPIKGSRGHLFCQAHRQSSPNSSSWNSHFSSHSLHLQMRKLVSITHPLGAQFASIFIFSCEEKLVWRWTGKEEKSRLD